MSQEIYEPSAQEESELNAYLEESLYEFNMAATGIRDGRSFAGVIRDDAGEMIGAINGHTWGSCCYVAHLWVHEARRGRGLGLSLLQAAEEEAIERGCTKVLLSTHSFQAPGFYARLGYLRLATVPDYPHGHSNHVFLMYLRPRA